MLPELAAHFHAVVWPVMIAFICIKNARDIAHLALGARVILACAKDVSRHTRRVRQMIYRDKKPTRPSLRCESRQTDGGIPRTSPEGWEWGLPRY